MDIFHDIPTGTSILSTVMDRGVRRILEVGGTFAQCPSTVLPPLPKAKQIYVFIYPT